jgi:hypothetical protein
MIEYNKVNPPSLSVSAGASVRASYQHADAVARFDRNWIDSYQRDGARVVYKRKESRIGFANFDLEAHGPLCPSRYCDTQTARAIARRPIPQNGYLMGVELEIERARDTAAVSDALYDHLHGKHVVVTDGSLRDHGLEIVTCPLYASEFSSVRFHALLCALRRAGAVSHDSGRCGLHVHVTRSALTERDWLQLCDFLRTNAQFFRVLSRRGSGENAYTFCEFTERGDRKYSALNLSRSRTAEFRFFRGTLKAGSFLASIQIVSALIDAARGGVTAARVRSALLDRALVRLYIADLDLDLADLRDTRSARSTTSARSSSTPRSPRSTRSTLARVERALYRVRGAARGWRAYDLVASASSSTSSIALRGESDRVVGLDRYSFLQRGVTVAEGVERVTCARVVCSASVPTWVRDALSDARVRDIAVTIGGVISADVPAGFERVLYLSWSRAGWGSRAAASWSVRVQAVSV